MSCKSQCIRLFVVIALLIGSVSQSNAQDLVFSQFQRAPLLLNPAFAGISSYPFISMNYRNQWPEFDKAYITYATSYNQYVDRMHSGFGIQLLSDQQADGIIKFNSVGLYYSYALEFYNDYRLKIGLSGTFGQSQLQWDRLVFADAIDPIYGPDGSQVSTEIRPLNLNSGYFDVSTGFLFYNNTWFVGLGLFHLNSPLLGYSLNSQNSNGLPVRFSLQAGYEITLVDNKKGFDTFIQPLLLLTNQAGFYQINGGIACQFDRVIGGVFYRHTATNPDAAILMMGYKLDIIELSYSYDITVSGIGPSGGSHEIGLVFDLSSLYPPKSKLNDCLKLFR